MKPFLDWDISTKMSVGIVGIAILAGILTGYISYSTAKKTLKTQITNDLELISSSKAGQVNAFFDKERGRVIDFASDGFIRDAAQQIQSGGNVTLALDTHLRRNKMSLDPAIYGINVFDLSGRIIGSTSEKELGKVEADDDYFTESVHLPYGHARISDVFLYDHFEHDTPSVAASAPLTDKVTGDHLGVIVNYIRVSNVQDILVNGRVQIPCGRDRATPIHHLVRSDGSVINSSCAHVAQGLQEKIYTKPVQECKRGYAFSGEYKDLFGDDVIGSSQCLQNGWILITELDRDRAFASLKDIGFKTFYVLFSIILISVISLHLYMRSVFQPITVLTEKAKDLGSGKASEDIKVTSGDEVGQLGHAFNEMAKKLKQKTDRLKKQKTQADSLAKELEKFKLAVDGAHDQVVITDDHGTILYANPATERLTGFKVKDILGKKAGSKELWGGHMGDDFYKKLWKTIKTDKEVFSGAIKNKHKNGAYYETQSTIYPILGPAKKVKFFVALERDVTKEKQIEQAKSEFISTASHQLRTPMTGIKWVAELLLEEGRLSKQGKEYVGDIKMSVEKLSELVDQLLNISRIEENAVGVTPEPIELISFLSDYIQELGPLLKKKEITLTFEPKPKKVSMTTGKNALRNIIQSIVSNAIEYTPQGGTVRIGVVAAKKGVRIDIEDTGIGIPQKDQKHVFKKFHRADNAALVKTDGTGLGLYIASEAVNLLGGTISFISVEKKGTTFTVELPLKSQAVAGAKGFA